VRSELPVAATLQLNHPERWEMHWSPPAYRGRFGILMIARMLIVLAVRLTPEGSGFVLATLDPPSVSPELFSVNANSALNRSSFR
jgi:hypothetical protein